MNNTPSIRRHSDIAEVLLIEPGRIEDDRGYFSENFRENWFAPFGLQTGFVQENTSFSKKSGTLRGMHFQTLPNAMHKLVKCTQGRILDVVVDIRIGSPTYLQHISVELSQRNGMQILVPAGFAHGFLTLEDHCLVTYKTSHYYSKGHDKGVCWDDPQIGIDWPGLDKLTISQRDRELPKLRELPDFFFYSEAGYRLGTQNDRNQN